MSANPSNPSGGEGGELADTPGGRSTLAKVKRGRKKSFTLEKGREKRYGMKGRGRTVPPGNTFVSNALWETGGWHELEGGRQHRGMQSAIK